MDPNLRMRQVPLRKMELSFALFQSLQILQMPQQELADWLEEEIEKNPLLELTRTVSKNEEFSETAALPSLYEYLQEQIRETLTTPLDRQIAEELIGHLDEKGFLSTPIGEIASLFLVTPEYIESVLRVIHSFNPAGIGARNLQEALLIQLSRQEPKNTLAYRLIADFFDDLLHGRYTLLKKKAAVGAEELSAAIRTLAHLQLRPAAGYRECSASTLLPDVKVVKIDQTWSIEIDEDDLPPLHIQSAYLSLLSTLKPAEKETFKTYMTSAKWLIRSVSRRRNLLYKLTSYLIEKQSDYLDQKGPLVEVSAQDLSILTGVHESTIHRALSGKIIDTPRGQIPLKSLISHSPQNDHCKSVLQRLVAGENKEHPLTDQELVAALQTKGFTLARRTIAKYRNELRIGSAIQRKNRGSIVPCSSVKAAPKQPKGTFRN